MSDRHGVVTFKGGPLTLTGEGTVTVGDQLPEIRVSKSLVEDINTKDLRGKKLVLNVIPSIDTPVCQVQTARFNKEAANLGDDVVILTISMDLPVAQARWCQAEGVKSVVCASDYKHREFGDAFGIRIKELGLLARAVYVVNRDGKVVYGQIVPEVASEPSYDEALAALKTIA